MPSNGSQWNEIVYSRMVETPIQVLINQDVKKHAMSEVAARISIDNPTTDSEMLIITSEAPPLNIMVPISALREAVRKCPEVCKHKSVLRPEEQELILAIRKAERTARDAYQADDGMHRSFALVEQMVRQRAMEPDPDPQPEPEEQKPKTRTRRMGGSHVDKTKPKTTRSRKPKAEAKDETVPDQAGPVRDK